MHTYTLNGEYGVGSMLGTYSTGSKLRYSRMFGFCPAVAMRDARRIRHTVSGTLTIHLPLDVQPIAAAV